MPQRRGDRTQRVRAGQGAAELGSHPDGMSQGLRAELLRRAERDQAARRLPLHGEGAEDIETVARVDAENLPWFKEVVAEIGWPGRSAVGEDGAEAAWLLAQHADTNPGFQRQCLDLLAVAADQGEATRVQVAYLTDRVLLAEGKPQEFGTQVTARSGQWVPCQLRDPGSVDQRRAAMSLGPLAENLARITEQYGPPAPQVISCRACGSSVEFWLPDPGEEASVECASCGHTIRIAVKARACACEADGDHCQARHTAREPLAGS